MSDDRSTRDWLLTTFGRARTRAQLLIRAIPQLGLDENTILLAFAVAIGTAVGGTVLFFYKLIDVTQEVALSAAGRLTGFGSISIVIIVVAGLVLARMLVRHGTKDSEGENVPDVMRAVAKGGGIVHAIPMAFKTTAAAIAIGAGGSVGAEGPMAVAGAALGSRIGRFFRSRPARLKVLVACGGAAGISAAFNAPIAGVFFALEKMVGSFGVSAFPPILVSSVIAAVISRAAFGSSPAIAIPTQYGVGSAGELVLYALLGVATGVVSVIYTRGTWWVADKLKTIDKLWKQLLLASLVVGLLDLIFRADLWGRGHETMTLDLIRQREAYFLVGLAFAKLLATALTLAATRSGGVFTPAMFIGATLGGGLAVAAREFLPGFHITPEAFALVGMAGLVAGSTHAPLTAIMIVFEMTSDYALILPLMLCGAIAYLTARRIYPHSIYSEWLERRGEHIHSGQDTKVLERLRVKECFSHKAKLIAEDATVPDILEAVHTSSQTEFPVVGEHRRFIGMITYQDLRTILTQADTLEAVVLAGDLAREDVERVSPDDTLRTALQRLALRGAQLLPVVSSGDGEQGHLMGIITRAEILGAYDRELLREQ